MTVMPHVGADQSKALETLAAQAHRDLDDVRQLYEVEREALAAQARITGFLSIFALRNVRARLLEADDVLALH